MTEEQTENSKPWLFQPGTSGNPGGRPKGSISLKTFARNYLETLSDEDKLEFLRGLPKDIVWKMSEGNPHTTNDLTTNGKDLPTPILNHVPKDNGDIKDTVLK